MTMQWYVVKHMPDLVRAEPRNIGVILFADDQPAARFVGEPAGGGEVDGRAVPEFGNHLVYKAWVRQWRALCKEGPDAVAAVVRRGRAAGDSFFIVDGGEQLVGDAGLGTEDYLDDLYVSLVRPDPAPLIADDVRKLTQRVLRTLGVNRKVQERYSLPVERDGVPDELWFDYRYDNGQPHFMQRVGLATADKSTWDRLHLVETTFERLKDSPTYSAASTVALIKEQDADARLVKAVRGRLADMAELVDVSDQAQAVSTLRVLFHLQR
jgi:hypothetical protein